MDREKELGIAILRHLLDTPLGQSVPVVRDSAGDTDTLLVTLNSLRYPETAWVAKAWPRWCELYVDKESLMKVIVESQDVLAEERRINVLISVGAPWQLLTKFSEISKTEWLRKVPKALRLSQGRPRLPSKEQQIFIKECARKVALQTSSYSLSDFDTKAWLEVAYLTSDIEFPIVWHYLCKYGHDVCEAVWGQSASD